VERKTRQSSLTSKKYPSSYRHSNDFFPLTVPSRNTVLLLHLPSSLSPQMSSLVLSGLFKPSSSKESKNQTEISEKMKNSLSDRKTGERKFLLAVRSHLEKFNLLRILLVKKTRKILTWNIRKSQSMELAKGLAEAGRRKIPMLLLLSPQLLNRSQEKVAVEEGRRRKSSPKRPNCPLSLKMSSKDDVSKALNQAISIEWTWLVCDPKVSMTIVFSVFYWFFCDMISFIRVSSFLISCCLNIPSPFCSDVLVGLTCVEYVFYWINNSQQVFLQNEFSLPYRNF
jgi:hypothetical protein